MTYKNTDFLRAELEKAKRPALAVMAEFLLNSDEFVRNRLDLINQQCRQDHLEDRAAFRCLTLDRKEPRLPSAHVRPTRTLSLPSVEGTENVKGLLRRMVDALASKPATIHVEAPILPAPQVHVEAPQVNVEAPSAPSVNVSVAPLLPRWFLPWAILMVILEVIHAIR